MSACLTLATVDGRRLDGVLEAPPSPGVSMQTVRFLYEMRMLHDALQVAAEAAALLAADPPPASPVAAGLALEILRDLDAASQANEEAQGLVPHVIGLVFVEVGPSDPDHG